MVGQFLAGSRAGGPGYGYARTPPSLSGFQDRSVSSSGPRSPGLGAGIWARSRHGQVNRPGESGDSHRSARAWGRVIVVHWPSLLPAYTGGRSAGRRAAGPVRLRPRAGVSASGHLPLGYDRAAPVHVQINRFWFVLVTRSVTTVGPELRARCAALLRLAATVDDLDRVTGSVRELAWGLVALWRALFAGAGRWPWRA